MASLIKAVLGSSSSGSQNQYYDPKLTPRVQPNAQDPTKAWDRLKVKQVVKRSVVYIHSIYVFPSLMTASRLRSHACSRDKPGNVGWAGIGGVSGIQFGPSDAWDSS